MNLIDKWLSGKRNYYVGAVLYTFFSKDAKLKRYFEGAPDKIKQQKLEKELQVLTKKPAIALSAATINIDSDEMPKTADPVLEAMRIEWNVPYQKMQYLRHELDSYEGNSKEAIATRSKIAGEILELEQECMVIWKRRDHYMSTGKLPEVKEADIELPTDPVDLAKMIATLERNIRRNKDLAKKHPDAAQYPLRAQKYQEQLDHILSLRSKLK